VESPWETILPPLKKSPPPFEKNPLNFVHVSLLWADFKCSNESEENYFRNINYSKTISCTKMASIIFHYFMLGSSLVDYSLEIRVVGKNKKLESFKLKSFRSERSWKVSSEFGKFK